ncbi:MAG: tRNA lysidine(34) synthetase TilS [Chromatiales bacterium]|nr:tRNA lysidine(34) synthetase TilS [Chromatiales bacterium]
MKTMLDILRQQLHEDLITGSEWCVALSGGVDSTVLLHAIVRLGQEFPGNSIRAVHVNHHLHVEADDWVVVCQSLCLALGVPLTCCDVTVERASDDGMEAAARTVRYGALTGLLGHGEILLTAHHRDDQVETLLLRLLRGAGPHGLASIELRRPCGQGWLLRPLLDVGRDALEAYARAQSLTWIEDPANTDTTFDRNFLRHRVLPILREHWPGLGETIPRAARLCGEAARILDDQAERDAAGSGVDESLSISILRGLPPARRHNVVRHWVRQRGLAPPAEARLRDGLQQLLTAGPDRMPLLKWGGAQMRRYRDRLYLLEFDPDPAGAALPDTYDWDGRGRIDLGPLRGGLQFVRYDGADIDLPGDWVVRFRTGGERFESGGQHKSVKNLFQEQGVVPWMRGHVPLLYRTGGLVAVGDLWQVDDMGGEGAGKGTQVVWNGRVDAP